jgi:hypothetical protein
MTGFIEVVEKQGKMKIPQTVNVDHILHLHPEGNGCTLLLTLGRLTVQESYNHVRSLLSKTCDVAHKTTSPLNYDFLLNHK